MTLDGLAMLAAPSNRTCMYLRAFEARDIWPRWIFCLASPTDATPETVLARRPPREGGDAAAFDIVPWLRERGQGPVPLLACDPNEDGVVAAVAACPAEVVVYSGPGGAILRAPILSTGKRFLHVHGGTLPQYRGSTCTYYELLGDGACGASAIFLDERIDGGDVVTTRRFAPPPDRTSIDLHYDPLIRSQVLVDVLAEYAATGRVAATPQDWTSGRTYYVIHPVLKHLAILAQESA